MNKILSREFWPVIHLRTEQELYRNLRLADAVKADGVFIIDHNGGGIEYTRNFHKLASEYCAAENFKLKIGVNILGEEPNLAVAMKPRNCSDVWSDRSGFNVVTGKFDKLTRSKIFRAKQIHTPAPRFWGSFAFKYQPEVAPYHYDALRNGADFIDVLVTSGPGTGEAADLEKVRSIRDNWAGKLAIASGVTPANVGQYLPFVDVVLCATGISDDFYNLNLQKAGEVARLCREYSER